MKRSGSSSSPTGCASPSPAISAYVSAARRLQIARRPRDRRLTAELLAPAKEELLDLARKHRRGADIHFRVAPISRGGSGKVSNGDFEDAGPYPLGCCRQIRDLVWSGLSNEPLVHSIRRRGLTWKKVYFIEHGRWFQNAIQCGDWLLDVAHDTVDTRDEPVICAPLDEPGWENLDDWRRFAEVSESYYRLTAYPNIYFPFLFPLIPFLAIRESGRLEFLSSQQMLFFLDLGDGWRRALALIGDRELMGRSIPPEMEKKLIRAAADGKNPFPVELRKTGPEEIASKLKDWSRLRALSSPQLADALRNFEKLAALAARRLRESDIRVAG